MRKLLLIFCMLLPMVAHAQTVVHYFHVQSGTGFFVNRDYIITNAHVVKGCEKVTIKGGVREHEAIVKVVDTDHDLALIQTDEAPQQFAPLRFNINELSTGDKVLIIGYPGQEGARGEYTVAQAQIEKLTHDVLRNTDHFYISDVIEHGNSGGPVFDTSGNVIGVVVAKTVLYTIDKVTQERLSEQHVGVVITLETIKQFLQNHGIYSEFTSSNLLFSDSYIEDQAKDYIVNVQCHIPTDEKPVIPDEKQEDAPQ